MCRYFLILTFSILWQLSENIRLFFSSESSYIHHDGVFQKQRELLRSMRTKIKLEKTYLLKPFDLQLVFVQQK